LAHATVWLNLKDTYRAVWGWQILFVPEKIPGMIWSMLEDYKQVFYLILTIHFDRNFNQKREAGYQCGRIL
jgi:putative alpha-1,2-mannosidase